MSVWITAGRWVGLAPRKRELSDLLDGTTAMAGNKKFIKERVRMIANKPKRTIAAVVAVIIAVTASAGCAFTGASKLGENDAVLEQNESLLEELKKQIADSQAELEALKQELQTARGVLAEEKYNDFGDRIYQMLLENKDVKGDGTDGDYTLYSLDGGDGFTAKYGLPSEWTVKQLQTFDFDALSLSRYAISVGPYKFGSIYSGCFDMDGVEPKDMFAQLYSGAKMGEDTFTECEYYQMGAVTDGVVRGLYMVTCKGDLVYNSSDSDITQTYIYQMFGADKYYVLLLYDYDTHGFIVMTFNVSHYIEFRNINKISASMEIVTE